MMQSREAPAYAPLLERLARDPDPIIDEVVADVLRSGDDPAAVRDRVDPVVRRLLHTLAGDIVPAEVRRLEAEGAAAARGGERVAEPIDRYLSAGWAIWDAATRLTGAGPAALTALGSALLRSGDRAAAALASGHGAAEREIAGRTAAARRAFVDDLLQLDPTDGQGLARLRLRADAIGIRSAPSYRPVVAWLGRELEDAVTDVDAILAAAGATRAPARVSAPSPSDRRPDSGRGHVPTQAPAAGRLRSPARSRPAVLPADPLGVVRAGRLVLIMPGDRFDRPAVASTLQRAAEHPAVWLGVVGPIVGAGAVAEGVASAGRSLDLALRAGHAGMLLDEVAVALEAALLSDPDLLRRAVDRELGAIATMPRKAEDLLLTLRIHLEQGQNIRATARVLGVAPRTIAYRIERIEAALGQPLEGPLVLRLAAAVMGRQLLRAQEPGTSVAG